MVFLNSASKRSVLQKCPGLLCSCLFVYFYFLFLDHPRLCWEDLSAILERYASRSGFITFFFNVPIIRTPVTTKYWLPPYQSTCSQSDVLDRHYHELLMNTCSLTFTIPRHLFAIFNLMDSHVLGIKNKSYAILCILILIELYPKTDTHRDKLYIIKMRCQVGVMTSPSHRNFVY